MGVHTHCEAPVAKRVARHSNENAVILSHYCPISRYACMKSLSHMSFRVLFRLLLGGLLGLSGSFATAAEHDQIIHGEQQIIIDYPTSLSETERITLHRWLQDVSAVLLTVHGEFPQDHFHITIQRSSSSTSPVPWGQVIRSTPTTVLLVANPDLGYDALINDWTAFHELSHLLLPYRGHGNVWFSEGLATYYQNIIQARSGLFNEKVLWSKLTSGFERGRKQQNWSHLNLTDVSDNLGETRQFMRVHWSGVLYWLSADVALRRLNKGNLDSALRQLKGCCESDLMSARAIARKLDEITAMQLFVPLFDQYSTSYRIPEYQPLLTDLGIRQDDGAGGISLDNAAPLAVVRQKIYRR